MNEYKCPNCEAIFAEDEMTRSDHRDGCCPFCGMDGVEFWEPEEKHLSLEARRRADFAWKPAPCMDWDEIRKAKLLCRKCIFYDRFNLGCNFWLIPTKNCPKRRWRESEKQRQRGLTKAI